MITLEKGAVYKSRHNGMVEYTGLDRFWGETTHRFRRLTCGGTSYVNLDEINDFLEPQETLESVKQQLNDLLAAQQDHERLVRQLDVLLNGEAGAAQQASLCDLVAQVAKSGVAVRSGAVPAGWQLVPVEVTLPMQHAYFAVIDKNMRRVETDCAFGRYDSAKEAYRSMLAAAPKQEGGAS